MLVTCLKILGTELVRRVDMKEIIEEAAEDGSILKIRYLDLRLGSKCNLKCIMCSHDSSMWVPIDKVTSQIENESLKETIGITKDK